MNHIADDGCAANHGAEFVGVDAAAGDGAKMLGLMILIGDDAGIDGLDGAWVSKIGLNEIVVVVFDALSIAGLGDEEIVAHAGHKYVLADCLYCSNNLTRYLDLR